MFTPISDRICMNTTKFDNNTQVNLNKLNAPTVETKIQSPEVTEKLYDDLCSVTKLTNSRDTLIIGGDFNAILMRKLNQIRT